MNSQSVTLHATTTIEGGVIEYARIKTVRGNTALCQTVMLHRLTPQQLHKARQSAEVSSRCGGKQRSPPTH